MIAALLLLLAGDPLTLRMADIAKEASGRVGACVTLLETGESATFHALDRFPMQSVYKMPIGMAILNRVDQGKLRLDQPVPVAKSDLVPAGLHSPVRDAHPEGTAMTLRELLRYMVSESDGTASDVLLREAGGPKQVTAYLRTLGVKGIVVATSEAEMASGEMVQYRNWVTPVEMVALLRALHEGRGLSQESRALLLEMMTKTATGPKRIKGLLPAGTQVAHKTGTSGTHNGMTRATNDVGIVTLPDGRHLAIAIFVADAKADQAAREAVIAKIAEAAWKRFYQR